MFHLHEQRSTVTFGLLLGTGGTGGGGDTAAVAARLKELDPCCVVAGTETVIPQICTDDAGEVESWIEREGLAGADLVTKDLLATLSLGFVVLAHADREQVWADCRAVREMEKRLVLQEPCPAE
ncbi:MULTISPECIES: hypothetical protein [Streptomyces]|uniref:Uncharacterized protein n=1 Tax=Streptomyces luteosporeus TaxID=173856 RepID=A0ABN3TMY3_9ACTN